MIDELVKEVTAIKRRLDNLVKPEVGRWLDWTPTVTQSGAVTATVTFARYIISEKTVTLRASLAITGSGTAGNAVTIGGLPANVANTGVVGSGRVIDAGTGGYVGVVIANAATTFVLQAHNTASTANIGVVPNFALASGDTIQFEATYERA